MSNNDKLTSKIQGLFAKAASVAGTAEADAFNEKAFELMAKYGIDERLVNPEDADDSMDRLVKLSMEFPGRFAYQRVVLLYLIAVSLNCSGVVIGKTKVELFGVKRNTDRVKILHSYLAPQMVAGASKAVPETGGFDNQGMWEHRISWMDGFADAVQAKITAAEKAAQRQRDAFTGDTEMALARESDLKRAIDARNKAWPLITTGGRGSTRGSGYAAGAAAGSTSDVGQARMGANAQAALQ